jgi:drug/metabolite transporter (DMT)-like permease
MRLFIGLILIAVGVFALLVNLDVLSGSLWSYVWPSIIIALGLSFFWGRRRGWHHWYWRGEDKEKKD